MTHSNPEPIVPSHGDRKHAKYGPSSMGRIQACPISVPLSEGIVESAPKLHTLEGIDGHKVCELYLEAKLTNQPIPILEDPRYTEEMKSAANGYTDAIYTAVSPYLQYPHIWRIEEPLDIDRERDCWGTPDFFFVYKVPEGFDPTGCETLIYKVKKKDGTYELHAILFDYKYGIGVVVDTVDNWQLALYALGLIQSIGNEKTHIETVTCHIYQPRVEFNAEPITYSREELLTRYLPAVQEKIDLIEGWKQTYGEIENYPQHLFDDFQRVGSHCQFCRAKARCKPYKEQHLGNTLTIIKRAIKENGKAVKEYTDINASLEKGIMSTEDLEFLSLHASQIRNLLKEVPKTTMSLMAKGTKFENIKIIETSDKRTWIADKDALSEGLKALGIPKPYELVEKWVTISDVEKILGRKEIPSDLITTPGVNYKIVPTSHKKPAVKFGMDNLALLKSVLREEKETNEE